MVMRGESEEKVANQILSDIEKIKTISQVIKHNMGLIMDEEYNSYSWFCEGIAHYIDCLENITKQIRRRIRKEEKKRA